MYTLGVVPQDTVLFNNTIRYNIQYGRIDAPEADVITAAKNADIHERILTFPDSYETQVHKIGFPRIFPKFQANIIKKIVQFL